MAFFNAPLKDIVAKVQTGELSSKEIVTTVFQNIQNREPEINAFISLQESEALKKAEYIDSLSEDEKKKLPLCGIPIAVKDNLCTKGVETTCASEILNGFIPPYDADAIERINNAGAIIVGKTNLDEFAMGSSTENSSKKITKNPHNTEHIPGGSSGGSAAAVAADFVPVALGSDTGGSIRQPSSHCGVFGLKPTYGRISRYGLVAYGSSLDQIGPLGQYPEDIGLLLSILSGEDGRDATCAGKDFVNDDSLYNGDVKNITIGIPKEYFGDGLSDEVRSVINEKMDALKSEGVTFKEVSLPNVQYAVAAYYIIATAEASTNLQRFDGVKYGHRTENPKDLDELYKKSRSEGFGEEVKRRIMLGTYVLSSGYYDAYYLKAAKVRTLITEDFTNAFKEVDAIISPIATTPAFKIGENCDDPLEMYLTDIYTVSVNLAGIPGISIPSGEVNGLPVGTQFMAPQWKEDTLIRIAKALTK